MPYSAGTAFLQVVPSFLGVEAAMRAELAKLGKNIDDTVARSFPEGMAKGAAASARVGDKAGQDFSGAFATTMRRRLDSAVKALPKVELTDDSSALDKGIARIRSDIEDLRKQRIGLDIDEPTAIAAVQRIQQRIAALQRASELSGAAPVGAFVDLAAAKQQVDALAELAVRARQHGIEAGDNFGGAFGTQATKRIDAAMRALPDVPLSADSTDVDRAVAALRGQLAELRDVRVGVDMDDAQFLARLQYLRAQLAEISAHTTDVPVKVNVDAAAAELKRFADQLAPQEGATAGDQLGGRFDAAVRQRVAAALKALPAAQITADSTDVDRAIAAVRAQLEALGTKHIGVDLDSADALAQITLLRNQLRELGAQRVNTQVKADVAEALTQLTAVLVLAKEVDRANPNITVSTNADSAGISMRQLAATFNLSAGQLAALVALGPALGAAIVPAAIASAGAVSSIGAAAVSSLGVAVLGLSGVGSAVKALNTYQQQTTKSSEQLAVSQNQVASAADAVDSAERSLANTRASVASGARQAAQQVADAQRGVADAERQARDAQLALNDAIEAARRQQQDLAFQVRGNALAQRQAALDLADAKAKLDALLANPRATAAELEQARITFAQRRLQVDQLSAQQKNLAADQAKADKAGVEGSQQVVAARNQIRTANENLAKAQQRLTDAVIAQQDQQRQGAFQLAQAQQSVVSAQRSLTDALQRSSVAGGAALTNLKTAMDNLSPAGQHFAQFLFSLKPVLDDLRASAANPLLPGLEQGITATLPLIPILRTDVGLLAGEMGHLSVEAGQALGSPYWRSFTDLMLRQSVPTLELGAKTLGNFVFGLSNLVRAFLPLGGNLGGGMLDFSERFATASTKLGQNRTFQALLEYARVNGPLAAHTIGDVVTAILHLAQAISPLGTPSLVVLRLLAAVINDLPTGVLQALAQGAVLFGLAIKGWDLIKTVRDSTLFAQAMSGLATATTGWKVAAIDAEATGAGPLGRALAGVRGSASAAGQGLTGMIGAFGPWGVAILAATLLVGGLVQAFTEQQQHEAAQRQAVDTLSASLKGLADNYSGTSKAGNDYLDNLVKTDENFRTMILDSQKLGLNVHTISDALHGNRDALAQLDSAYTGQIGKLEGYQAALARGASDVKLTTEEQKRYQEAILAEHDIYNRTGLTLDQYIDRLKSQRDAANKAAGATNEQNTALGIIDGATGQASDATQRLNDLIAVLGDKTASTTDKINALKDAEDNLNGASKSVADTEHAFAEASIRLTESLTENKGATDDFTTAGHANIDALKGQISASVDVYNATLASTNSVQQATDAYNAHIGKIYAEIDASGLSRKEKDALKAKTHELIGVYGQIPTSIPTNVSISGVEGVEKQLDALAVLQRSLEFGEDLQTATNNFLAEKRISSNMGHAAGGPIIGPGGPTDDLIPAWLSNGEYIIPADVVRQLGLPFFDALIGRRPPRAEFPGDGSMGFKFASGGLASLWPFMVDVAKTKIPTVAEVENVVTFGPAWIGSVPQGMTRAQAFVRAQVGKPYGWASAGPFSYDCSGIVAAARNVALGLNPYEHTFSTFDEARYFTHPGWGLFTAGWSNPGEGGPGGGPNDVGHTAAKIGNLTFESTGSRGVHITGVTPLGSFAHLAHMAAGGPVKPWVMDKGGMLAQGWNPPIFNGTGRPEPILPAGEFEALVQAANRPAAAGATYQFAFRDTTLDPGKLRALQDREDLRARIGRAR